jgi:hypothetical protein
MTINRSLADIRQTVVNIWMKVYLFINKEFTLVFKHVVRSNSVSFPLFSIIITLINILIERFFLDDFFCFHHYRLSMLMEKL